MLILSRKVYNIQKYTLNDNDAISKYVVIFICITYANYILNDNTYMNYEIQDFYNLYQYCHSIKLFRNVPTISHLLWVILNH